MNCTFCKIINNELPSYTIYEDEDVKCFLSIDPIHNAHTLVVPKKHILDMYEIDDKTLSKVFNIARNIMNLINDKFNPSGIKLIQNNGSVQEVKHYHLHIIPIYDEEKKLNLEEIFNILTK